MTIKGPQADPNIGGGLSNLLGWSSNTTPGQTRTYHVPAPQPAAAPAQPAFSSPPDVESPPPTFNTISTPSAVQIETTDYGAEESGNQKETSVLKYVLIGIVLAVFAIIVAATENFFFVVVFAFGIVAGLREYQRRQKRSSLQ